MPRRLAPVVSFVLLLGLFVYLFWVPLRPTAWGGPRTQGPFESEDLPSAGRLARDVRVPLERLAIWRSPDQPLAATGEVLLAWHAVLAVGRFAVLWLILWLVGGRGWLATLGVVAAALPMIFGAARHTDWDVGLLLFVLLLAATTPERVPWGVALLGLPILFVVWANAHASTIAGLGWLGVMALGRTIEWWRGAEVTPGRLLLAVPLCVGAVCLNPDGPRLLVDAFRAAKVSANYQLPGWQPIDFSSGAGMPWAYFTTLAGLFVLQLVSPRALRPTAMLVVLSFGFWPVLQQRGLGYWWIIAPWLAIPLVAAMWRRESEPEAEARADASALASASGSGRLWPRVGFGVAVVAVLTTPAVRWLVLGPRPLESIVSCETPARLSLELTADPAGIHLPNFHSIVGTAYPNGRYRGAILAEADQGDFLAWVLDRDDTRPVMVYSRSETFDPGIWAEAFKALEGGGDWWEILGRHQVNLIAISPTRRTKLADRLRASAEWAIVEDGPALLVAVRRVPKLPVELQPDR